LLAVFASSYSQETIWGTTTEGGFANVQAMTIDAEGNVYSIIQIKETVDFDPSPANFTIEASNYYELVLQKLDADGNLLWIKNFITNTAIPVDIKDMVVDKENNLVLVGNFIDSVDFNPSAAINNAVSHGDIDVFILKLTSDGLFIDLGVIGNYCRDEVAAISLDSEGNYLITGRFCLTVDFDPTAGENLMTADSEFGDVFILKLASDLSFIWSKHISSDDIFVSDIAVDSQDKVIIAGGHSGIGDFDPDATFYVHTSSLYLDAYVLKLTEDGSFIWAKFVESDAQAWITGIDLDSDNNVYTLGLFNGNDVDFNPDGTEYLMSSLGDRDYFMQKYDAAGNFVWANSFGSSSDELHGEIEISDINTIYFIGNYGNDLDLDPSAGTFMVSLDDGGTSDLFFATYSNDGAFLNGARMGGEGDEMVKKIMKGTEGILYFAGSFLADGVDFDPSASTYVMSADGHYSAYVVKLQDGNLRLEEPEDQLTLSAYPNPIVDRVTIDLGENSDWTQLSLVDETGRLLLAQQYQNQQYIVLDFNYPRGVYFVHILNKNNQTVVLKLVK